MTEPTTARTEAEAIAELAIGHQVEDLAEHVVGGIYPPSWAPQTIDLEQHQQQPRRKHGTTNVRDTASLLAYIDLQEGPWDEGESPMATIYYTPAEFRAVAVFNGHTMGGPGWGDHRCTLQLKSTDEWLAWTRADKAFSTAPEFAEHIEEWRHTIADPPTADLLDMVRSFRATTKVTFRQELVDKSGDKALEYVTETEAKAGATGKLEIPDGFDLVLAPFEGAEGRPLRARFRYRLDGGRALFGVVLEQPALVAKAAFEAELARIREHAPFVLINGEP